MAAVAENKYALRSLHEDIGLFDRKLAHMAAYEKFASEAEREAAMLKLAAKRKSLVEAARRLVSSGVEFNPSELPRSLRPAEVSSGPAVADLAVAAPAEEVSHPTTASLDHASPLVGTSLD